MTIPLPGFLTLDSSLGPEPASGCLIAREPIFCRKFNQYKHSVIEQTYIGINMSKDSFMVATRQENKIATFLHSNDRKGYSKVHPESA
ncbi:hypothetical protein CLV24_12133 [Pontibacter ummariensis]|uniref:Uncharacterized protein n=1 Tax=Pontibacter ummariensis TaxID=1610492 RepID=A0A239JC82_9BACT|nr:hypothetical protein CLV24_12133 [Pontibacter ummariensis]SNT03212.1 hypothetical protein SAMN06296052_12133 [Pontibacter ummariensis]